MHVHTSDQEPFALGFGQYTCNWGVHMCGLYESDAERDDLICSYLHQGDVDGDLVRYMHAEPMRDRFAGEYARRYPGEAGHPGASDAFVVTPIRDRYCAGGRFDPLASLEIVRRARERARAEGRHLRSIAEMDWVLEGLPGSELLIPYEAHANSLFDRAPMIITCLYDLRRFSGATIMGVLRAHRFSIMRGLIVENPFYDPQRILDEYGLGWPALG
jgi:hypothetical protein